LPFYLLAAHLFVSFVPFVFSGQLIGFWHYNKILFLRFLAAVLYSTFIYLGLILALGALHLLFEVKIPDKLFFELWITVACLFNTWFFVAGVPKDFEALETRTDYPKALRLFSQYVLLPLLALYLIILYAYGMRILLSGDWPKGIVSYLIICVSVLGSLSFLLLHPYGEQNETAWIKKAGRGYYFLLIPLLFLLFYCHLYAIGRLWYHHQTLPGADAGHLVKFGLHLHGPRKNQHQIYPGLLGYFTHPYFIWSLGFVFGERAFTGKSIEKHFREWRHFGKC
jgi:hypothetical protein